jgi:hypothetical protein
MKPRPTPKTDALRDLYENYEYRATVGDIWELCEFFEREHDEAQEYADRLAEGLPDGMLPKDVEVLREANLGLATELATVTAQRDMLAEVLQRIRDGYGGWVASPNCCEDCDYLLPIDEALQSLTPKP